MSKSDRGRMKRPKQLIAVLIMTGITVLVSLGQWFFYISNSIVYSSSLGISPDAFPIYLNALLLIGILFAVVFALLLFGLKVGYWVAVVLYAFDILDKILALNLIGIILPALSLYFLLSESVRVYFHIKKIGSKKAKK